MSELDESLVHFECDPRTNHVVESHDDVQSHRLQLKSLTFESFPDGKVSAYIEKHSGEEEQLEREAEINLY